MLSVLMIVLKTCNKVVIDPNAGFKQIILLLLLNVVSFSVLAEQELAELAKPIDTSHILGVVFGLLFVLLLFFVLVYALKKLPAVQGNRTGILKVLDTMYLGSNEKIILLKVAEKQILIGVNPQSIGTLHVIEDPIDIDINMEKPQFKDKLSDFIAGKMTTVKKNNE